MPDDMPKYRYFVSFTFCDPEDDGASRFGNVGFNRAKPIRGGADIRAIEEEIARRFVCDSQTVIVLSWQRFETDGE